ncbi:hypothetical protein [Portibacter lacus]|uniref:Uncharacterized protein n=1 Tax=Portibacter lacus TaxID=1099794 RepID=A0AA37WDE8_9BACT|nr:hypothetical protein [Portibacter lacus]GLR15912.1 hypothetical protein GCM10007940_05270 [Portibacter lacus]
MKKITALLVLTVLIFLFVGLPDMMAQCPMCRMSAESNLEHGGTMGKGLNRGILYILSLPYLLVLSLGIIWYRNKKKTENEGFNEELN